MWSPPDLWWWWHTNLALWQRYVLESTHSTSGCVPGVRTHWYTLKLCRHGEVTARQFAATLSQGGGSQPTERPSAHRCPPSPSMTQTPLSSASPWTGFQTSSLPSTCSDSSAAWKTHTGSKNRAVTCKNRIDGFQNRDGYFIAQEWRFFSMRKWAGCSEGNQICVLVLGVSAHWVVPLLFPLLKLVHRANEEIYETIIVPYAQYRRSEPDKVSEDAELSHCGFYFHKRKCQMLDVFYATWNCANTSDNCSFYKSINQ